MNDFFEEEDIDGQEPEARDRQKSLWIVAGFIGLVILIVLLVIAIDYDRNRYDRRTARQVKDKITDYKSKPGRTIRPGERTGLPGEKPDTRVDTQPGTNNQPAEKMEPSMSVVRVIADKKAGSATLLSRKGYFLTNYHVVQGSSFQVILFARDPKTSPEQYFATQIDFENEELDIAILKVVSTYGHGSISDLSPVILGDSSGLKLGNELYIYGYPNIGGDTITMTRGVISGFLEDESWIKTDANAASGNSGGGAFNQRGELVGIPTARTASGKKEDSQITIVRPIHLIRSYISPYL